MKFWLATNKNGDKFLHSSKPRRSQNDEFWFNGEVDQTILVDDDCFDGNEELVALAWVDEPVEIEINWIDKMDFNYTSKKR